MSLVFMEKFFPLVLLGVSFLIGSIPVGLILARLLHVKEVNRVLRRPGARPHLAEITKLWPAGVLNVALDVAKGVLATLIMTPIAFQGFEALIQGGSGGTAVSPALTWASGLFAVLGHCFSPWLHLRGGKGVAATFGVILVLSPVAAIIGGVCYFLTLFYFEVISLASIAGLVCAGLAHLVLNPAGIQVWFGAFTLFIVLLLHESNVDALLEQREPKFVLKFK